LSPCETDKINCVQSGKKFLSPLDIKSCEDIYPSYYNSSLLYPNLFVFSDFIFVFEIKEILLRDVSII
jgi:hypothetical protein